MHMPDFDVQLSRNLQLHEMLKSSLYPDIAKMMNPTPYHLNNMHLWAQLVFQPIRDYFDVPIYVESGLRIGGLNELVNGSDTSMHPHGKAGDIFSPRVHPFKLYEYARVRMPWVNEVIYYPRKGVVHIALPHFGKKKFCQVKGG